MAEADHPSPRSSTVAPAGDYSRFFRLSNELLIIAHVDGSIHDANESFQQTFGYTLDELRAQPFTRLWHPDDYAIGREAVERLARGEGHRELRMRMVTSGGETRIVEWSSITEPGADGIIYAVGHDATERVRADEQSRRLAQRLGAIVDNAPIGIVLADARGARKIRLVNGLFSALVGYTAGELCGMTLTGFTHPDDFAEDERRLDELVAGDVSRYVYEKRYVRKDGSAVWVRNTKTTLPGDDGRSAFVLAMVEDIEDRRRFESFKDNFIANAAHELRTPATAIVGFAAMLAQSGDEMSHEDRTIARAALLRQATRMHELIATMLDFARIEQGRIELRVADADVEEIVDRAIESSAPPERVRIATRIDSAPLSVRADADRLVQVVANLLTNAFKYGGDEVRVEARRAGGFVDLAVADSGAGVPETLVPHLFEPFRRGENVSRTPGSGLGLAIVRMLVQALGGQIRYERADPGARFVVSVPAA